jgi:N-hydroxyarylamine O-acetyltransferase
MRQPRPQAPTDDWTRRYLALLGVEHPAPSLEALTQLTRAHVERVPFGTVTSLFRKRAHPVGPMPPLDPAALLEVWERRVGSGVCFEIAEMVWRLLLALGYRAHVTLGTVGLGWPGGHQAVVVDLDGRRHLVDVGNGAPLFEPIPLDGVVEARHVGLGYRFRPGDDADHWIQERCIDGAWEPFCTYDLRPATPAGRDAAYQRHHVPSESWVVTSLLLVRCGPDGVDVLRDASLTRYAAQGKTTTTIDDPAANRRLVGEVFGAPDLPIDEARAALAAILASPTASSATTP